ncbi:bifunctional riboflavin kinase/FAD synthetase [Geminicoccaceae bacterium 1502E]|nr:bifunctional riboflavin kinase/FAD synthetase [Geminicoccaceae bacterium 1502E]
MRIFRRFDALPAAARGACVAIGNFDGLHQGHRAVLAAAREEAARLGAPLGVVTFEPHPREVLAPETAPRRLAPFAHKAALLRAAGVELCVALPFDETLMRLSAEGFAEQILHRRLGVQAVAAGQDFRFGHRRSGDLTLLTGLGTALGFSVRPVAPLEIGGRICSSTAIRGLLAGGDVAGASALLGRPHTVEGRVRPGDQRGRTIGFPTANVHPLAQRVMLPAVGVYAVRAEAEGASVPWPAVANLGRRPTFDGKGVLLEVHLLEGRHELYGRRLRVQFLERLRDERRFADIAALTGQIERDCAAARRVHGLLTA